MAVEQAPTAGSTSAAAAATTLQDVAREPGASKPDPILVADDIKRAFGGLVAVDFEPGDRFRLGFNAGGMSRGSPFNDQLRAGAAAGLATAWQEYVPLYRSAAGTGCGMGFAAWG
mgnify:CR=1 FL=1